jgi:glycosyltransferase involved in cell wall biosynthesis
MRPLFERTVRKGILKFLGPLPRAKALKILAGSDVVVLPSREEGVSTVLLEAMALKVPIVATRVGGTIEILRNGEDAILVNSDPKEIKNAVIRLLTDSNYARKLTEKRISKVTK